MRLSTKGEGEEEEEEEESEERGISKRDPLGTRGKISGGSQMALEKKCPFSLGTREALPRSTQ